VDANVSNLAVASFPTGHPEQYGASVRQAARAAGRATKGLPAKQVTNPGGRLYRASTQATAMSQHCPCGKRVAKTLAQRTHDCPHCGLRADRDITSAALAACVELADPHNTRTARVDYRLAHALRAWLASPHEWEGSVNRHQPPASPDTGSARTGSHRPVTSAEQAALGLPPNSSGPPPGRRGPSRKQPAPKLISAA
jgi:hypothetical protein